MKAILRPSPWLLLPVMPQPSQGFQSRSQCYNSYLQPETLILLCKLRVLGRLFADLNIQELVQLEVRLGAFVFPFAMLKWQVLEISRAATAKSA